MRLVCAIIACLWLCNGPAVADHVDLVTGRVLYLPFDGTLADDSGNMHTVIETGSVGFSPGILGAAADFDGTQTVVFPSIADTYLADSGFTIAFWFRIDLAPVQQRYSLLGQRDVCNFDDFIDIRPSGAEINLAMGQPSQVYRVDAPYALGEWHHYAAVHDGLDLRLYLNGELIDLASSDTTTFSIANPLGIAVSPCIGVDGTEPYIGLLDELLVYDRALDSEQVRAVAVGHIFADGFEASN